MRWNLVPGSTLSVGQTLAVGDYLQSPGKTCFAVMQTDGNLCVYAGPDPNHNQGFVWSCNDQARPQGDYHAILQSDGNFVVYEGTAATPGPWVWSWTTTPPPHASSYFAQLDDHGWLTVHTGTPAAPDATLWGNFGVTPGARIEHLVVIMLENRGFDTALGYLYTPEQPPLVNTPPLNKGEARFHGLAFEPGVPQTGTVSGKTVTRTPGRGVAGANSPGFDPGEEFEHVNVQLFGKRPPGGVPTMDGFLLDFGNVLEAETHPRTDKVQVMESLANCFAPWDLPNLSRLASTYGVSDRWFSSVPTQTNANRAFSLCGQSQGEVNNGDIGGPWKTYGVDTFAGLNTIFNTLSNHGMTDWAIYYNELYPPELLTKACYTELAFPQIDQAANPGQRFQPISNFLAQARAGRLPRFSYIEPKWGGAILDQQIYIDGNDYHPPVDITHSEQMMQTLYQALTANRAAWNRTLVVVLFDEHGGTYDHVPPGPAVSPPSYSQKHDFHFDRYGVRVPALFLSPYVAGSTVVRSGNSIPFDHTSMLASVLDWSGIPRSQGNLGKRTATAPNFWRVLNLAQARTTDNAFPVVAPPPVGTTVRWGQRFYLRNNKTQKFITSQTYSKVPGYSGWYPLLGVGPKVAFELRAGAIGDGYRPGVTVPSNGVFQIRSSEYNQITGRKDEPEWYNSLSVNSGLKINAVFLDNTDVTADLTPAAWRINPVPTGPINFGAAVRIESVYYPGYMLSFGNFNDYLYLTADPGPDSIWTLEPAPSGG